MDIFVDFSQEFSDMGTGSYGLAKVMLFSIMQLPLDVYRFFPMAGLLGSLIGLGLLASRSELIVMRAAGVSIAKITWMVIKASFVIMIFAIILGEGIAPFAQHFSTAYKAEAMSSGQALYTRQGIWVHSGLTFFHIGEVFPDGHISAVTRYQLDDNLNLRSASFAKWGIYQNGKWIFKNIAETKFLQNKTVSEHYKRQHWRFDFEPKLLGLINVDTDEKSLPQLYSYIKYLHTGGLAANKYEFAFWQRIVQPFAVLVMILLAMPFIFGPLRTVTMGLRILAGAVVGFGFYTLHQFSEPISIVYQIPPLLVALLPILAVGILSAILLLRSK